MNSIILLLTFTVACSLAMPTTNYGSSKASTTSFAAEPAVTILKQINQLNDDGSYAFGYEASDGTFRLENMDANGYLTGRFGYVDSFGKMQETEYVAGKLSGQSLGYQARGTLISTIGRKLLPFPFIRTLPKSVEQKALDYQNTSVDDDEDGFPDSAPVNVRVVSPAKDSYGTTVVRVAGQNSAAVSDVRVSTPTQKTPETIAIKDISLVSPSTDGLTDLVVRVVEKNQKTENTSNKIADARISHVPVVVRVTNVTEADTPTIIKQKAEPVTTNIQQLSEQVSIIRSPTDSYVKSAAVKSTGKVDEFIKSLETNIKNVGNHYNTNDASGAITLNQNQFQQDIPIQEAQPIQGDAISVDSIGIFSTA